MRRISTAVIILLAVCMSASAQDCKDAIKSVRDSWLEAWNAKKLDDVMKLYAEDATLLSADGNLYAGREKIRDYFKTLIGSVSDVTIQSAGVICSTQTGYDTGTYSQTIHKGGTTVLPGTTVMPGTTIMGGTNTKDKGNYAVSLQEKSGNWLVVQHANVQSK